MSPRCRPVNQTKVDGFRHSQTVPTDLSQLYITTSHLHVVDLEMKSNKPSSVSSGNVRTPSHSDHPQGSPWLCPSISTSINNSKLNIYGSSERWITLVNSSRGTLSQSNTNPSPSILQLPNSDSMVYLYQQRYNKLTHVKLKHAHEVTLPSFAAQFYSYTYTKISD